MKAATGESLAGLLASYEDSLDKGIAACQHNDLSRGREYLLLAAERLLDIAERTDLEELRAARIEHALALMDDAEALTRRKRKTRELPAAAGVDNAEDEAKPRRWEVLERPGVHFDDIAGLEEVKETIRRRVLYPFQEPEAAARYRKQAGGGVLLYGPPGTGKTMLAKAIATELEATFFAVKSSDVLSKWVGDAEKNVRELFDAARACPLAVIFFDEAEALVSSRGRGSTVMDRVIPEFLAQIDGLDSGNHPILLLGATNRPWDMDEAALRPGRFGDELIYIGLPDAAARRHILRQHLEGIPAAADVSIEHVVAATEGFTGADVVGLVDRITDRPYSRQVATGVLDCVTRRDVEAVLGEIRPSVTPAMLKRYEVFSEQRR